MTETKYDKLLRDFLEAEAEQRAEGITLKSLHRAVSKLADDRLRDRQDFARMSARQDRHGKRIGRLEDEVQRLSESTEGPDWRPDPRENTGQHDLAVLKAQHDEMRDEEKWARRQRWIVIGSIAAALVVASVTGCVTYAVSHVEVKR